MDRIRFKINGKGYSVGSEVTSDVTLVDYLRNYLQLRGTKYMCRQAGCGTCIVAAVKCPGDAPQAVNSCMVSITSCKDWEITTIEELGNRKKGYHFLQKSLADYNGSQCGYCSPGWVMSMYCLLQNKKDLTMLEIEKSFGSNICRCTGYRPILEAFKRFAKDAPKTDLLDIEDLDICEKTGKVCTKSCTDDDDWYVVSKEEVEEIQIVLKLKDGRKWFHVNKVTDIFYILNREGTDSYMLVAGNTAKGAYPIMEYPQNLIDISGIPELKGHFYDQNLVIRAGTLLTDLLEIFKNGLQRPNFGYLKELYDHLLLVAHIPVRNLGTIAGNLMIKHQHKEFQSDLFLMFTTLGAVLTIMNCQGTKKSISMEQFLNTNMRGSVILNVKLPPLSKNCKVKTYKVMPRSQNAHAVVNFGAFFKFNPTGNNLQNCRLSFGGLSPTFTRATATENFLVGKPLFTNEILQSAIRMLEHELVVVEMPPEPSAAYRRKLAIGLFYKSLLSICPRNILKREYLSGSVKLHETRQVSQSRQSFETTPSLWPLNKPIPKLESLIQCAGEATYTEDVPSFPNEVFAELVLSTIGKGKIVSMDSSRALNYPGVIEFYTAKDIPGLNSFVPADDIINQTNEEVLSSGEIKYYNQPIAIIVAKTRHIAEVASKMVDVTYSNVVKPVIDIKQTKNDPKRNRELVAKYATDKGDQVECIVRGSNTIYGQYHFTTETLAVVTRPTEEGLEVFATSQWPDALQTMIARALNMDGNKIDVYVRRIGGGFGIKVTRIILAAVCCSLVTTKCNRPCRIILSIEKIMRAFGKRMPCSSDYDFAVNKSGVIQFGNFTVYEDNGFKINEKLAKFGADVYSNCYIKSRWNYKLIDSTTDTAKNSWFRAPGTLETIAMVEMFMEHISYKLSQDPVELRLANLDPEASVIKTIINTLMSECKYKERRASVNQFNAKNRWRKRGFRCVPLRWTYDYTRYFDVNISVYHVDGTVAISHGGVEIGQGINTKTAQICAHFLNIPLDKVQVKVNSTINTPNSAVTGGSVTSQYIGVATERACKELLKRLEPVKAKLDNPTWEELISKAYMDGINLQSHGFVGPEDVYNYFIYSVAFAEVEIDVLTGESEVMRVDVMGDAGQSVNPALDIGQEKRTKANHLDLGCTKEGRTKTVSANGWYIHEVWIVLSRASDCPLMERRYWDRIIQFLDNLVEGAFIMGLGYWTSENLVYDKKTGELLTDRTWNYYVPQARDIPQDFRVCLLKGSYSLPPILGSKAIGEPPICLSVVVPIAIREAITAARFDSGIPTTTWYPIDGPYTVENICMATSTKIEEYRFN